MKWFAVLYPQDNELRQCLDGLVLFANPAEKDRAHVTLRGPCSSKIDVSNISEEIVGQRAQVLGAGAFFQGRQNTVFLHCDAQSIKKFWYKPDFDYNPHLTIYDGPSREFAEKILEKLKNHNLHFEFVIGECLAIPSTPGQKSLNLIFSLGQDAVFAITGHRLHADEIREMPEWRRLTYIERICTKLNFLGRPGSKLSQEEEAKASVSPTRAKRNKVTKLAAG